METLIEYPSYGTTYFREEFGVYQYSTYPKGSVLAGQQRRSWLGGYDTLAEAQADYPDAEFVEGSCFTPPALDHLRDGPDLY